MSILQLPHFGRKQVRQKLTHLLENSSNYSLLYNDPIPSTAPELKRLLCCYTDFKSAYCKCKMMRIRTSCLNQLALNL
jgi:hypothetical protein